MDQNIVWRDRCCLSLHVVLCRNAFSFSTVSVKGREKKTHSCCFCLLLYGYSVSCCPSSLWNISFQAFCDSEDFSQHYISKQYMLESLSSKKLHPEPVEESDFMKLTTPYSFTFFVGIFIASFILSNVQQTNWTWKTPYCTLLTSLRSYLWGNLTTLHPGYSYILLVPLYFGSAVMFWVMQAELENLKFIAVLGIIHGALEDLVSYISCNLEKKISFFGKFSHSSPRETNGWYRYHKHVFWINWYCVC